MVEGRFTAVQQAIATHKEKVEGVQYLCEFVREAVASGFVQGLLQKHGVADRLIVPPGEASS